MSTDRSLGPEMAISLSGVSKRYGDTVAVDDLSLNVRRGEIYGFLGLNGAGKTTTIRMLLGLIRPAGGLVRVFGRRVSSTSSDIWSRVGYLVDVPAAYRDLTVRENLEVVRRLRRLPDSGSVARVMERLRLADYANRRAGTLSLGNAQRLGLAKALIHSPELLVLDEPANGLDPAGIVEVRDMLRELSGRQGVTIFMSSHILSEVHRLATRIGVIHRGRLIEELGASELSAKEKSRLVVDVREPLAAVSALQSAGVDAQFGGTGSLIITDDHWLRHPDEVATVLVRTGHAPTRLVVEREDLESHFLSLVGPGTSAQSSMSPVAEPGVDRGR